MKRISMISAVVLALSAAPAVANDFAGPRVGVEIGLTDDDFLGSAETSYGVNVGYDLDLGNSVVGVTGGYTSLFDNDFDLREFSVGGRAGLKVSPKTLAYGSVAYSNLDADNAPGSLDGAKFGVGLEHSFGNVYANLETRYGNYQYDVELYQTVIGVGYRF